MSKHYKNFNNFGGASCVGLLLLALLLVNPLGSVPVSALEGEEDSEEVVNYDDQIMPTANTSDISISFSPTSGSASLTPTNSAGQSTQINVLATVGVKNSGGYSVYVKGSSQNLVGQKSSSNVIPGVSGSSTYANLPVNTWGYYAGTSTAIPENATYKAVTTSGNGDKVAENTNTRIDSDTKTIALSFAAKVNDQKPADTYKNTITLSVVSSPKRVSFAESGISTMQGMTSNICSEAPEGDAIQLRDTRDGKYYWIGKLADGKCWMTQNLDLDLSTSKALTPSDSDVSNNWTPEYSTTVTFTTNSKGSSTSQRSWDLGNYRIIDPTNATMCPADGSMTSPANCSRFTIYDTPTSADGDLYAHYILGNHYQWNTVTAGTGGTITSGQASGSVCPKGWRLPTSGKDANNNDIGEFQGLISAYNANTAVKLSDAPLYFVRSGDTGSYYMYRAGTDGNYWSATPRSDYYYAYALTFATSSPSPSDTFSARNDGYSVRCIAR